AGSDGADQQRVGDSGQRQWDTPDAAARVNMTALDIAPSPADLQALRRAVQSLENPRLAARLADHAGQPVNRILRLAPRVANEKLNDIVKAAIFKCLETAI